MKVFIKHIFFLLLVILGLATLLSESSLYFLRQGSFYKPSFVANSLDSEHYDYLVLGSSIGLTTLNTIAIDSITGLHGVNLSMDDTGLGAHYLMLEHFLAEGKTTDYCVLSSSAVSLNTLNPRISTNDYRFLPYIRRDYVKDYFGSFPQREAQIATASSLFSFIGVSFYNAEIFYPSLLSLSNSKRRNRFDASGNFHYPLDKTKLHQTFNSTDLNIRLQNPYLEKLKKLCEAHAIQLVVYVPPIQGKKVVVGDDGYLVVNHSTIFTDSYYFNDMIHVNFEGRQLASSLFAEELKSLAEN